MFMPRSPVALAVTLAVIAAGQSTALLAQPTIEEVVVTGQRQAYRGDVPIAQTPQSIVVLDQDLIQAAGLTGLSEVLDLSASMARQNNFGGLWDNFATRGFAGDENLPSGYLVNGFNAGRGFGGPRDVSAVERVEILRGPNAALFGRGEPGGTINLVTKRPEFEWAGSVAASAGSFDTFRGDADLTGPVTEQVAIRLTGFHQDAGSFRDTIDSKRTGVTPSLLIKLGERTSLSWDGEFTRQEIPFDRGIPAVNDDLGVVSRRTFLGEPGDGPIDADVNGHQIQLHHEFSDQWSVLAGVGLRDTDLEGFSSEAELVGGRQALAGDGRSLSRQRRSRDYEAQYKVFRTEIAGQFETGAIEHRILIGADHDQFENSQLFLRFRPPALSGNPSAQQGNVIDVLDPVYGSFPLPVPAPQTNRLDEQEAWGIYLQDHMTLGERLHVRIGGRYDDFEQSSLNRANNSRSDAAADRFSPQVGAVYDVSDSVSLYAAYGEGFRQNAGANAAGAAFEPEESKSLEVGVRLSLLDGALTASLALFDMEKTNIITADPGNPGFSLAIGKAESQGIEVDVAGRLPGQVDILFSYAYVDAESAKNVLDPNFSLIINKGDRLINVPEHTLSLVVSRDFEIDTRRLTVGAAVQHVGERLGETATTFELPDYTLVRLLVTYAMNEQFEVSGELNNVFDETYYTNSFARLWVAPGAPRNAALTLRYRF